MPVQRLWSCSLAALIALLATAVPLRAEPPAPLAPFQFLLGEWDAVGDPTAGTGGFTFAPAIQDRVIVRTNYSNTPAANGQPASRHDDLMVIFVEGNTVKAEYFDNEGHVIRYVATARAGEVAFISEIKADEPRYRLRYRQSAAGTLDGRFDIAPPGKPDAFTQYLAWSARRRSPKPAAGEP